MKLSCAYCGKEFEPNRGQMLAVQRGMRAYCSDECRVRFRARERGITEEGVLKIIKEAGGEIQQSELFKKLGVRDETGRTVATEFVSLLEKLGLIEKEKVNGRTVILRIVGDVTDEVVKEEVGGMVDEEIRGNEGVEEEIENIETIEMDESSKETIAETVDDVDKELEQIRKQVESINLKEKLDVLEDRIAKLESRLNNIDKRMRILKEILEKLVKEKL